MEVVSNLHCRGYSLLKIHTPLSISLSCLIGSSLGLTRNIFGIDKNGGSMAMSSATGM